MKVLSTIMFVLTSFGAFAGGGGGSKDDILFPLAIIAGLTVLLALVYLFEFIARIRKDKDYRDYLRSRVANLISTVRAIFTRKKEEENGEHIDYAISLSVN